MIFDDLANVVLDFSIPGGVSVERRTLVARNEKGELPEPQVSLVLINPVVIYPLVGAELEKRTEGDRDKEHLMVFAAQELRTARAGTNQAADVILFDPSGAGNFSRYRVIKAANHSLNSAHWECVAKKEESP